VIIDTQWEFFGDFEILMDLGHKSTIVANTDAFLLTLEKDKIEEIFSVKELNIFKRGHN
jgi:hypothetical protein